MKPFKTAVWNEKLRRWEGTPPKRHPITFRDVAKLAKKLPNAATIAAQFNSEKLMHTLSESYQKCLQRPKKNFFKKVTKRTLQVREYNKLKPIWRARPENEFCKRCLDLGKQTPAMNYPHHKKGRAGKLLVEVQYFMPTCIPCHRHIHDNVDESYRLGYLIKSGSKQ